MEGAYAACASTLPIRRSEDLSELFTSSIAELGFYDRGTSELFFSPSLAVGCNAPDLNDVLRKIDADSNNFLQSE